MARQEGKKCRADVMVIKKREQKMCDTEKAALELEAEYRHQLIDGKPLNKVRGISQISLREAGNNALNNPKVGWKNKGEYTPHGRKQHYYIKSFCEFWGEDKPLREIKEYIDCVRNNKKTTKR